MLRQVNFRITPRDRRVAELLVNECMSSKEIAKEVGMRPRTVKQHLHVIYRRAGLEGTSISKRVLLAKLLRREDGNHGAPSAVDLTPREESISRLVARGMSNRQIAEELGSTEQAIKKRLRKIFDKTGMSTRLELAAWYDRHRAPGVYA